METTSQDVSYHSARLLVLIDSLTRPRKKLVGLTKLAKLDFLLRYPVMLERLLSADGIDWPSGAEPSPVERGAVESRMIRYKYGPWDDAYYPMIRSLAARGLLDVDRDSRGAMRFTLTKLGRDAAKELRDRPEWSAVALRSDLLRNSFDSTGNQLKERIYRELPDVVDRPHRTEI